ncbi:MAG: hypothetical protein HYU36_16955 [Planctomycetes bacterium]|nr:hypothetical protein [Planctomycetota bacterium]
MTPSLDAASRTDPARRRFLKGLAAGLGSASLGGGVLAELAGPLLGPGSAPELPPDFEPEKGKVRRPYRGPCAILVRFGGGVRRRETIQDPQKTYSPYLLHELTPRGTLFTRMEIVTREGVVTSHGEGTLNILTGKYDRYEDVSHKLFGERFEAKVPTVFEYLRREYDVPEHQTLIINGEDRIGEEFYTFSNHHLFGVQYRSNVLSLYRFKTYLLRRQIREAKGPEEGLEEKRRKLHEMENQDPRVAQCGSQSPPMEAFWERWRDHYGETGLVNPRGDELLTELAVRALRELRPRLVMVNYNDCDYVHWGNLYHYTRGISIMDRGLQRLVEAVESDEEYRGRTVFAIVPDCGRDDNRCMAVPCQHHFGSKSSHEIFALFFGPGVPRGRNIDRTVQQIDAAPTVGRLMGFNTPWAESKTPLPEASA